MSARVQTIQPSNSAPCAPLGTYTLPKSSLIQRLSEWFWPVMYEVHHYETHNTIFDVANADYDPNDGIRQQSHEREKSPCKGCRMAGKNCDRQRPHCAQCLDQQVLCFYVEPLPKIKRMEKAQYMPAIVESC